ncbi:MAG: hypothetical protein LBR25_09940 [Erysipelotrichaceae bacterium]|jgi:hypothetical protein|nr:hypothetical protein [Erysipelotrichaceae bacterium]
MKELTMMPGILFFIIRAINPAPNLSVSSIMVPTGVTANIQLLAAIFAVSGLILMRALRSKRN